MQTTHETLGMFVASKHLHPLINHALSAHGSFCQISAVRSLWVLLAVPYGMVSRVLGIHHGYAASIYSDIRADVVKRVIVSLEQCPSSRPVPQ